MFCLISNFLTPIQGTNQQQDTRFSDKEKKLLKQMKFGDCLNKKVKSINLLDAARSSVHLT